MNRGYSLIDVLVAVSLMLIVSAMVLPLTRWSAEYSRASAAARWVAGELALNRMKAVKRNAFVALRFEPRDDDFVLSTYVDGNRNGIRSVDVNRNIDTRQAPPVALGTRFPGVKFGLYPGVPSATRGDSVADGDPIRIGRSQFLSFSPLGSATAGTIYIRGRGHQQFAVRILGVTGRVRVLRFDFANERWIVL